MSKQIFFLCLCILLKNVGFASVETLKLIHEQYRDTYGHDWVYHEDIELHRQEFLKWISKHGLWDLYSRVILTMSCHDSDYIPKCPDAGKIFHEGNNAYQLMHNGVKVLRDSYCGRWMTDLIYAMKGHHEPQEEKVFYEVLKYIPSNAVMVELGSYWAYYSLWFAKEVVGSRNYLIEPDPERLDIGRKNFALNNAKGHFFRGYVGECNTDAGNYHDAKRLFIDAFLEENRIDHVAILHADIQGAEYLMLESAIRSIKAHKIDYFFISTHGESLHLNCMNLLKSYNYVIIAEHTPPESFSVDGLIVARRNDLPGCEAILITKKGPS